MAQDASHFVDETLLLADLDHLFGLDAEIGGELADLGDWEPLFGPGAYGSAVVSHEDGLFEKGAQGGGRKRPLPSGSEEEESASEDAVKKRQRCVFCAARAHAQISRPRA